MIDKLPPLALPIAPEATETIAQPGGSQLVQVRLIRAPRERVWTAWTEPDQLGQWWGPAGFSLTTELFEFRVGGHWVFTMHGPDPDPASRNPGAPRDFPNHVVWDRIERGGGSGDGAGAAGPWVLGYRHVQADSVESALFTSVVTFEERDGRTLVVLRDLYPSKDVLDAAIASDSTGAFPEQFEQLDEVLGTLGARAG